MDLLICRRNIIIVCGDGTLTNTYPWECTSSSCPTTFSTVLGPSRWNRWSVDAQYCTDACVFRSELSISNDDNPNSPITVYSDNSNSIDCSWVVCSDTILNEKESLISVSNLSIPSRWWRGNEERRDRSAFTSCTAAIPAMCSNGFLSSLHFTESGIGLNDGWCPKTEPACKSTGYIIEYVCNRT